MLISDWSSVVCSSELGAINAYIDHLVFGIYPYIALSVLVIGSIIRFDREPYSWRSGSSQLLRRKQLMWGSVLFHVGVLFVLFGHIFGLLVPIWVFDSLAVKHEWKQRSEEHTSELQSLMRISYAVFCLKK